MGMRMKREAARPRRSAAWGGRGVPGSGARAREEGRRGLGLGLGLGLDLGRGRGLGWSLGMVGLLAACGGGRGPLIEAFTADPARVESGEGTSLLARFSGGVGRVDPGGVPVRPGRALEVRPARTTTYVLAVEGPGGLVARREATVVVAPALEVLLEGLAGPGLPGPLVVEGPSGWRRELAGPALLRGLAPGRYRVRAPEGPGAVPWEPVQEVDVDTAVRVTVRYPAPRVALRLPGGVAMPFVLVPAGSFAFGSEDPRDAFGYPAPAPVAEVAFPRAFYMAAVPTTRAQWEAVLGGDPPPEAEGGLARDRVSFDDVAERFLPALRARVPGLAPRLPSEAEWEWACRAGSRSGWFFGEDPGRLAEFAWTDPAGGDHPVGGLAPNPWGLHDLSGCVYQWCEDEARDGHAQAPADGSPCRAGDRVPPTRILRGRGPVTWPDYARSAVREHLAPWQARARVGFRLVLDRVPSGEVAP